VQHHAQDAVDAESAMPEAGVGVALFVHLVFGPRDDATLIRRRQPSSSTVQPFWKGARTSVGPSECTGGSPSRFYSPDDADGRRRGVGGPGSMDRTLA
jgi:hypothetical protein